MHGAGPPKTRLYYGYIVVAAAFFVLMLSFGLQNTYGVFFQPLVDEFGWTRALTSGAFSLSMVTYGIVSIAMGGFSDRFGPRLVVTFCGLSLGLGYLLMSRVHAVWQLYVFFGVMTGVGIGGVWGPLLSTVARWFTKRRSLMTGIALAGMGIGTLIASPVLSRAIAAYGFRLTYVFMGGLALIVMVAAAQFLRRDPYRQGQLPYGEAAGAGGPASLKPEAESFAFREAVKTPQFWLLTGVFFFRGFCTFAVLVHIVPHALDLGASSATAAGILAAYSGVGIMGSILMGAMGDRMGNRAINIIGYIMMAVSLFWLVVAGEVWMLFAVAVISGFAQGGMSAAASPLLARLFGLGSHGLLFGIVALGFRLGAGIGPLLTGYVFDLTGRYQMAFLLCAVFAVTGILVTLALRPTRIQGGRI